MTPFAPRLHVLLARDVPLGLVIRRGPSRQVATVMWDRKLDEFQLGQWLKGRIYERRSDLSPDGKYFLYFAMNGRWESKARGSWTAISQAPYLKALALFAKGDCWHGGGLWTGPSRYWLNDGGGHEVLQDTDVVRRHKKYSPEACYGGECLGVYYPRLLRDGWRLVERQSVDKWKNLDIFEKPVGHGWILRKIAHAELGAPPGKGCYWDEHELVPQGLETPHRFSSWEWADLDGERLAWCAEGKLWTADVTPHGLVQQKELFDFGTLEFSPIAAPY